MCTAADTAARPGAHHSTGRTEDTGRAVHRGHGITEYPELQGTIKVLALQGPPQESHPLPKSVVQELPTAMCVCPIILQQRSWGSYYLGKLFFYCSDYKSRAKDTL